MSTAKKGPQSPSNTTAPLNAAATGIDVRNARTQPTVSIQPFVHPSQHKLLVDKEGNKQISGVVQSISGAIASASSNTVIKITAEIYTEELVITKPNITLEPKSEAHEVILI